MVEQGWQERGADDQVVKLRWFDLLCAFFAHQLKSNPAVRDIFASKALAQLLVNGRALTLSNIEARLAAQGGLVSKRLASVDAQLEKLSASQDKGFATVLRALNVREERLNQTLQVILEELQSLSRVPSAPSASSGTAQVPDLEEAHARLSQMPTLAGHEHDHQQVPLPPVYTLPRGSRMIFAHYAHFVGREPELRRLASILKAEHKTAAIGQMVAATGLGGIGKTQLAIEFAHRYGHYFAGGVFWLDFSVGRSASLNRPQPQQSGLFNESDGAV